MIINHNISAMNSNRNVTTKNNAINSSLEKLSSGMRINKAGDDAAGLAISEKMRGQVKGLDMASKNAQDGISLIQTAEGALNETHSILQRMRELAVQSSNDTNTTTDRNEIQKEMNEMRKEIDRIADTTEFNTKTLMTGGLDGGAAGTGLTFHVGANENQAVTLNFKSMKSSALGVSGASATQALSVTNAESADAAISTINDAIESVSAERSKFGAMQNRLEHTINNLNTSSQNLQSAESRIRDVDMAKEMVDYSKNKIISQAGNSMLAQANANPQSTLQLLS